MASFSAMPSSLAYVAQSVTQPNTITINPAAGPLIVICELLMNAVMIPPAMAVKMPASGGQPLAPEMPRHNGSAIKNTMNPDKKSCKRFGDDRLASGVTDAWDII
jgi:hypothetical protein